MAFTRSPQPLTFEASSGIFVGNAGGTGLPRFVVSLDGARGAGCIVAHHQQTPASVLRLHRAAAAGAVSSVCQRRSSAPA